MTTRRMMLMGALALGLAACGRKGPLEPPPGTAMPKVEPEPQAADTGNAFSPGVTRPKKKRSLPVPPKDPFILDPIL